MTVDLEERLERVADALPQPSEAVSAHARRRALAALARPSERVSHASRGRLGLIAVGCAAAAAAVLLLLAAPWDERSPLATERALAALGDQPVIHAVVENLRPEATIVDLASGAERPQILRTEYWYDDERSLLRSRLTIEGKLLTELLQTREGALSDLGPVPGNAPEPRLDPALAGFASRYREALETGQAQVIGEDTVEGRDVVVLRMTVRPAGGDRPALQEEVAVDADSYRPLRFRFHSGQDTGHWWRVVSIETVARDERQFAAPAPAKPRPRRQTQVDERTLTLAEAATALGRPAMWPGSSVEGIDLTEIELMKVTTEWSDGREDQSRGLLFRYGEGWRAGSGDRWLVVTEASSVDTPHFGSFAAGPALEPGQMRLVGVGDADGSEVDRWFGRVELDGVYVALESPNREVLVAAARALTPMR
jgi:hypothetical protein